MSVLGANWPSWKGSFPGGDCEPLQVPSVEELDQSRLGFSLVLYMEMVLFVLNRRYFLEKYICALLLGTAGFFSCRS